MLIDGRSIYTPFFSSVFWDQQQIIPEDIERIEVVSGPGGTLWGSNAVNGVINIITKNSRDTQGGLLDLAYGSFDKRGAGQWGGKTRLRARLWRGRHEADAVALRRDGFLERQTTCSTMGRASPATPTGYKTRSVRSPARLRYPPSAPSVLTYTA